MSLQKHIYTFLGFDSEYINADIAVFGVPFDGTASYRPGARFAPMAMREASEGLEIYSPYLDREITEKKIFDAGNLEINLGNTPKTLESIYEFSSSIISDSKKPLMIGGEHLISYPVIRAVFDKYPDLYIIHIDAHTDLRDDYVGEKLSHASVIRRAWELVGDKKIFQLGIRSGEKYEFEWAKEHTLLHKYNLDDLQHSLDIIKSNPVYITIDLDVLDPSVFPGTGTPEPGGIRCMELINAIHLMDGCNIVGADIVELSPHYDPSGVSTITACKVLRELALIL